MSNSFLLFLTHVIEIMFFTGLVGCVAVVAISWISIFGDGFSDPRNKQSDAHWSTQNDSSRSEDTRRVSASLV
jgi:hypothetical protein